MFVFVCVHAYMWVSFSYYKEDITCPAFYLIPVCSTEARIFLIPTASRLALESTQAPV